MFKTRNEPLELTILRFLNARMKLSEKDMNIYLTHEKGFYGEKKFDELLLEYLSEEWLIISDLLLEYNNTYFQIDTVLLSHEITFLIDVKNYKGDYYIKSDKWYSELSEKEIKNPLEQLKRSESLFRRYIQDLGFTLSIESYLVFINPEFTLYQAPRNPTIIFPSQLQRFMNKLKKMKPKVKNLTLAQKLVSDHIKENPFVRLPLYSYDQLKKGIICEKCCSLNNLVQNYSIICKECGHKEKVHSAVLRSVDEYRKLFPDRKVMTNSIYDWCGGIISENRIQRILVRNFKLFGQGKSSYYI
ncbi:MAG: nuclease-related domain-containing protein [Bacillota bacterium]|nr:nuclease-related domain-containing protein [Bacillota bacterium]